MKFINLKTAPIELFNQTINWLKSLTKEIDFEHGEKFALFIQKNSQLEKPLGLFILYSEIDNKVVGVISLVSDDQNVGSEHNLDGIWIAGVQIHRDFRGKGYGNELFNYIDQYISDLGIENFNVNLFTNNSIAMKLYEKYGFKKIGLEVEKHNELETVFSKVYNGK